MLSMYLLFCFVIIWILCYVMCEKIKKLLITKKRNHFNMMELLRKKHLLLMLNVDLLNSFCGNVMHFFCNMRVQKKNCLKYK